MDIERIMQEIRAEIKEKGYKESDLCFRGNSGSYAEKTNIDDVNLDLKKFRKQALLLNVMKNVNPNKSLYANSFRQKLSVFFQRVLRKSMKFYIEPIVQEQNEYNDVNAYLMIQLYAALLENNDLKKRVEKLEEAVQKMEES